MPVLAMFLMPSAIQVEDAAKLTLPSAATVTAWEAERERIAGLWRGVLGPDPEPRCDLAPVVLESERVGDVLRTRLSLQVEPECRMECYLLRPVALSKPAPGVVVLHSTVDYTIRQPAGLEGPEDLHIGLRLAEQGYVALCPRCFLWDYAGAQTYDQAAQTLLATHPGWTGLAKMIFDATRAVDYLASLPDVDPLRIGCIGHSLGAKEALFLSAFDARIGAAVSSEGGVGLGFSNWDAPWYLGPQIHEPTFARENHEVLALVAPRPFLLIGGGSADGEASRPFVNAASTVYRLYGAEDLLVLFVHDQGHAFPPSAQAQAYGWLRRHLGP